MTCPLHIDCEDPCPIEADIRLEMAERIRERKREDKYKIAGAKASKREGARLPWDQLSTTKETSS